MKKITVNFIGFWNNFDYKSFLPYILLKKHYEVTISDNPDFLFCSIFDDFEYCKHNGIRIFCTSECIFPDMNVFDYAISILNMSVDNRVLQIPYFMYIDNIEVLKNRGVFNKNELLNKTKFCNFIYSHPAQERDKLFHEISKYKIVDAAGKHLNNMDGFTPGNRVNVTGIKNDSKIEFQTQYKFTIACENYKYEDYVTEKIIHAYMAMTIPIYYGDPNVTKIFNNKSFINVSNYKNKEDLIEKIKEIDTNDDMFLEMINQPVFKDQGYIENKIEELDKFLINIIESGKISRKPDNYNVRKLNAQLAEITNNNRNKLYGLYKLITKKIL